MTKFLCVTCGTQFPAANSVPEACPICEDERQYVSALGQRWTRLDTLQAEFENEITLVSDHLYSIITKPKFAIGQQAHLIQTAEGNILWDCISYLDKATIDSVKHLGGIRAIAISHPHYYSSMLEWAEAFAAPIYLHAADKEHVVFPSERIHFWQGEQLELQKGITLINSAGHYEGGTVLHWQANKEAKGSLLTGDIIQVVADPKWVSFMYSYPNIIPLSARKVRRIVASLESFEFEKIYGAFGGIVQSDAKNAVKRSAERYIRALQDD